MTTPLVMLVGHGRSGKDTAGEAIARDLGGVCVALADPIKRYCADPLGLRLTPDQLWGKAKETTIAFSWFPVPTESAVALSRALCGWKTPAELMHLPFAQWSEALPRPTTPRHIMQTFGTECVRSVHPNFWIDFGLWCAERLLSGGYAYDRELGLTESTDTHVNMVAFTDGRFRNEVFPVKRAGGVVVGVERPGPATQAGFSAAAKAHASETEQNTIPRWWFDALLKNDSTLGQFQGRATAIARELLGAAPG